MTVDMETFPLGRQQLISIADSFYRVNVWEGSVRSGKTISSIIRWMLFLPTAPTGGRLLMIGRTRDSLYRNVIQPMQDPDLFGEWADEVKYTPGAPTATIMGKTIHVMGASDVSAEKVVRGLTLAGAYCDEITILEASFFKQLLARMSVPGAQLFGTTNPDSPYHWFKTEYLDRIDDLNVTDAGPGLVGNWASWHFTLDDNPGLSEAYKNAIKAEYTGLWYQRFILGQWVSAEGAVYDMWDDAEHVVPWAELPRIVEYLAVGIDYGTTNPTSAIIAGVGEDGVIYLVDEWRYAPTSQSARLTDRDLSERIRAWLNEPHHPSGPTAHPPPVVLDPAAASFHVQLHQDGTRTYPAENDVLYGIRTVSTLLAAGRLKVSDRCTGFIEEVTGYAWDQKATDEGRDAVIKANDHSLDAARYALITTERRWRQFIPNI